MCAFVRGAIFHCSFLWPLSISKMPSQHTSLKRRCTAPKNFQNAISPLKQNKSFVHSEMLTHVFAVATQFFFVFLFQVCIWFNMKKVFFKGKRQPKNSGRCLFNNNTITVGPYKFIWKCNYWRVLFSRGVAAPIKIIRFRLQMMTWICIEATHYRHCSLPVIRICMKFWPSKIVKRSIGT